MSERLDQAFTLAAGELGMASAAWLFAQEVWADGGDAAVQELRDELGRRWPVLDAICAAWLDGARAPTPDAAPLLPTLAELKRVVIVGLEARWLDALAAAAPKDLRLGLVRASEFTPDWDRVLDNLAGRVELLELGDFQSWAGPRSALLTFVYGAGGAGGLFALSAWVRVAGPDVRTQFRELIGWDVLRVPVAVYPRWLVAVTPDDFTSLESP